MVMRRAVLALPAAGAAAAVLAACKSNGSSGSAPGSGQIGAASTPAAASSAASSSTSTSAASSPAAARSTLNLGFFPNLTHAPALVGLQQGFYADSLGSAVTVRQLSFNAGPAELSALLAGSVDIAFIGPSPTITGYIQSKGAALKVIAGACSGGAQLVVSKDITAVAQLKGKKVGSPQLGNTQDVALRYYLRQHGLTTTAAGGGDVAVVPAKNSVLLQSFQQGQIAGAWVPEPYASEFVLSAGGHVLVDEKTLWPRGQFVTTNVAVGSAFLAKSPDVVADFLKGEIATIAWMKANPAKAKASANTALGSLSGGKPLSSAVLDRSWTDLDFTADPLASTLAVDASHAVSLGLATSYPLTGLYDLGPLNSALTAAGQSTVQGL
jgi:NitT/TauT family transport system substrate-binding protein